MAALPLALTGKVFVVGDASTANLDMVQQIFDRVDPDGTLRFFSTIDAALSHCTANAGDVILVCPGHTETISSATSLVVDVAGVQIIGIGRGSDRPELNFSNTAGSVEMDAANTRLSNLILKADVSAVVVGVNVDADNVEIDHCQFTFNATGDDFVTMIDVDAVNGAYIHDNEFIAEDTAGCDEAIRLDDADDVKIVGNHIYGDFSDSAIVGEGAVGKNLLVQGNTIYNSDTTAGLCIDLNVAFTGLLVKNALGGLVAAGVAGVLDPGSCLCIENFGTNAIDESSAAVPTTAST